MVITLLWIHLQRPLSAEETNLLCFRKKQQQRPTATTTTTPNRCPWHHTEAAPRHQDGSRQEGTRLVPRPVLGGLQHPPTHGAPCRAGGSPRGSGRRPEEVSQVRRHRVLQAQPRPDVAAPDSGKHLLCAAVGAAVGGVGVGDVVGGIVVMLLGGGGGVGGVRFGMHEKGSVAEGC